MAGMLDRVTKDPFQSMMGSTWKSPIFVKQQDSTSGLTTKFDWDGFLTGKSVLGKTGARGKGEAKRFFSDSIEIIRQRFVVSNGDPLDAMVIGRSPESMQKDSIAKLSDVWMHSRQQNMVDCAQGTLYDATPTHVIRPNNKTAASSLTSGDVMDLTTLDRIVLALKEGTGFSTGADRMPYLPYTMANGKQRWRVLLDPLDMYNLRQDADFKDAVVQADVQGTGNLFFSDRVFEYQNLLIEEMPRYVGCDTEGSTLITDGIIIPGARLFEQSGFKTTRSLVLGQSAMIYAKGIAPFALTEDSDFGIESESAMTVHHNMKKTRLTPEAADYTPALKDIDFGVLTIECYGRAD